MLPGTTPWNECPTMRSVRLDWRGWTSFISTLSTYFTKSSDDNVMQPLVWDSYAAPPSRGWNRILTSCRIWTSTAQQLFINLISARASGKQYLIRRPSIRKAPVLPNWAPGSEIKWLLKTHITEFRTPGFYTQGGFCLVFVWFEKVGKKKGNRIRNKKK